MAEPAGLTYDDLLAMAPEETTDRTELLGGELVVSAAPSVRHQRVIVRLTVALDAHVREHGGEVFGNPLDAMLTPSDVVQPDVMLFGPDKQARIGERPVTVIPDLVVEVSSPSTRRTDLGSKRNLYEQHGVPEYWFVDLEKNRVLVHRLEGGRFRESAVGRGDRLETPLLPGLSLSVDEILRERTVPSS